MSSDTININLLGRTYSVACPSGQEDVLRQVAAKLEEQLNNVKSNTSHLKREEVVIMAALNIGHALLEEQQKNQEYTTQIESKIILLQSTLESALVEHKIKEG